MSITTSELEKNPAGLNDPNQNRVEAARSLFGILPADITLEEAREEKLGKFELPVYSPEEFLEKLGVEG